MRRKWLARGLPFVALLLLAVEPAAAASSTTEELIRGLNQKLLVVAIPITVLVEGILIYTILRFKDNEDPKPTRENRRLEITWTVATAVILLFVGFSAYSVLGQPDVTTTPATAQPSEGDLSVDVTAEAWAWHFEYEGYNVTSSGTLYLQQDRHVYLNITSTDWLHAVHVPELGLKQDAVPGQYNVIQTTPTATGTFQGYCAEYCGSGHSGMLFTVVVVEDQAAFEKKLAEECNSTEGMTWSEEQTKCVQATNSSA